MEQKIGKKRLLICILLTSLLLVLSNKFFIIYNPITLFLNIDSDKKAFDIQTFYARKFGVNFNPNKNVKQNINLLKNNAVEIKIPSKRLNNIKIFFNDYFKTLTISSINLTGNKNISIQNYENFIFENIKRHKIEDNKLILINGEKSPSITFNESLNLSADIDFDIKIFIILASIFFFSSYKLVQYIAVFKIKHNHSRIDIVFLFCFFSALFIPMMKIDKDDFSLKENRKFANYEPFIKDNKINLDFGKNFEDWFNDRFFGRNDFIKIYNKIKTLLNPKQGNESVLIGNDGWIFYKKEGSVNNFQNTNLFSDEALKNAAEYLQNINDFCERYNKKFYFFISPDKNKIYGEFYKNVTKINDDKHSRGNQLIKYLSENTAIKVIYPFDELISRKKEGKLLYWKNDTHWNELGAYYGYKKLMQNINKSFNLGIFETKEFEEYHKNIGDLTNMYPEYLKEDNKTSYFKPIIQNPPICKETAEQKEITCNNNQGKLNAVLFRDSFSNDMLPYLSITFNNINAYWHYQITKGDMEIIKKNADIIIFEIVERNIHQLSDLIFPKE